MAAKLERFSANDPHDAIVEGLLADGGVMVEGMLDGPTLAALEREVAPHLAAADAGAELLVEDGAVYLEID